MKYGVLVEPPAAADIDRAYLWVAKQDPESAVKWFNGLCDAIETLATFPDRCPHAPENEFFDEGIRQLIYGRRGGRYRILFTIVDQKVHVLHVRHARRLPLGDESEPSED